MKVGGHGGFGLFSSCGLEASRAEDLGIWGL